MVNLDPKLLQAKGLSPVDVLDAMAQQNVVQPGGTAKIGQARVRHPGQLLATHA